MDIRSLSRVLWAGALATCAAAGCGGKSTGAKDSQTPARADATAPQVDPTLCDTEGKRVVTSDLDRDGRPDVWKLYQTTKEGETTVEVLACKQVDFNHDDKKDYVVAYTPKGGKTFEKYDFDFDGRFDAFFQFNDETGKVFEIQRETGFDGHYDLHEIYDEAGVLTTIKHDRNGDGEPDKWEQFVEGKLVAILYDDDYDMRVDRREEVVRQGPAKPTEGNDVATGDAEEAAAGEAAAGEAAGK